MQRTAAFAVAHLYRPLFSAVVLLWLTPLAAAEPAQEAPKPKDTKGAEQPAWKSLFDGKTLKGWKTTEFGGEGEVDVKDGVIVMEMGSDMTGITWAGGELPRMSYELSVECQRVEGNDFFCGLTFPVGKDPCSLIVGGWGGGVVGLSSIDGFDASENETTEFVSFKTGKWYQVRLMVTPTRIEAWIDNERLIDQITKDRKLSIRPEVELSKPLGFSTWQTKAALRNIKIRQLTAKEIEKAK